MTRFVLRSQVIFSLALLLLVIAVPAVQAGDEKHAEAKVDEGPSVAEQVMGLDAMCAANAEAMAARKAEKSLYDRLGGEEKIHEFVVETVRLHDEREEFKPIMEGVDRQHLIDMVTEFLVVGTGGEGKYTGRGMVEAHKHLALTNAEFLAAGSDLMQAMASTGCGEPETQELVCMFASLRAAVVIESEREVQ